MSRKTGETWGTPGFGFRLGGETWVRRPPAETWASAINRSLSELAYPPTRVTDKNTILGEVVGAANLRDDQFSERLLERAVRRKSDDELVPPGV